VRLLVGLLVLLTVAGVLVSATLGTFFVGLTAASACTPDGENGRCLSTTVGPWANVALQVVVLVVGLAAGSRSRARSRSGGAAAGATLAVGVVTLLVSWAVLGVLLVVVDG